jgi:hypothetical protein
MFKKLYHLFLNVCMYYLYTLESNLWNSLNFDNNAIFVTYWHIYLFILFSTSSRPTSDSLAHRFIVEKAQFIFQELCVPLLSTRGTYNFSFILRSPRCRRTVNSSGRFAGPPLYFIILLDGDFSCRNQWLPSEGDLNNKATKSVTNIWCSVV